MKFKMIIKRRSMDGADAIGYAIEIPALKMHIDLTPEHIQEIKENKHYDTFLEKLAVGILEKKEEKEGLPPTDRMMDTVLKEFYKDQQLAKQDFDLPYEIEVEFKSKKQCRCCTGSLPCLVKILIPIEIAAGTVLTIATLQWTQGTSKEITISQVVASAAFMLCTIFIGPGMTFMKDFGKTIDSTLHRAWHKITCRKPKAIIQSPAEEKSNAVTSFPRTLKFVLVAVAILGLNNMWVGMSQDYQQFLLLSAKAQEDSALSPMAFTIAVWINFILNQPNDVLQTLSSLMVLQAVIVRMFNASRPAAIESNSLSSDWLDTPNKETKAESKAIDFLTGSIPNGTVAQNGLFSADPSSNHSTNTFPSDAIAYTPPVSQIGMLGSNNAPFPKGKNDKHMLTQRLL
jgi:hypothetical protein